MGPAATSSSPASAETHASTSGSALSDVRRPTRREGGLTGRFPAFLGGHVNGRGELVHGSVPVEDVRRQHHVAPVGDALGHFLDAGAQTESVHVEDHSRERAGSGGRAGDKGLGRACWGLDFNEHLVRIAEATGNNAQE